MFKLATLKNLAIGATLAAAAVVALAVPVQTIWSSTNNEGAFMSEGATRYLSIDLTLSGWRPGIDMASWGNDFDLRLDFQDDAFDGNAGFNEVFGVSLGSSFSNLQFVTGFNFRDGNSFLVGLTRDAMFGLNNTGVLSLAIDAWGGDFWMTGATISAYGYTDQDAAPEGGIYRANYVPLGGLVSCWNGTEFVSVPGLTLECPGAITGDGGQQIPEPGSLALLGLGFLAVGVTHQRRAFAHHLRYSVLYDLYSDFIHNRKKGAL